MPIEEHSDNSTVFYRYNFSIDNLFEYSASCKLCVINMICNLEYISDTML